MTRHVLASLGLLTILAGAGCSSATTKPPAVPGAPAFADFTPPDIPATLRTGQADRDQQAAAWRKLQAEGSQRRVA
jgi:hypothetical protein